MKIRILNNYLYFIITFLSFVGFYFCIILYVNLIGSSSSQTITIPLRIIILLQCLVLFLLNFRFFKLRNPTKVILIFFLIYLIRILYEYSNSSVYYLDYNVLLLYLFSFAIIPNLIVSSLSINKLLLKYVFKGLLFSGFLFSIAALYFYKDYFGTVGRLNNANNEEGLVNPLILSYNSILIIGVFLFYIFYNKTKKIYLFIIISSIILSTIPFLLGSSRGSLIALIVPIIIVLLFSNLGTKVKYILFLVFLFFLVFFLDNYFQSGLFSRFESLGQDYDKGDGSAIRLSIWNNSFNQFLDNPFIGDKLRVNNWINYPHNIFLEVLQTIGFFGFIPFLIYIILCFKSVIFIIKNHKKYIWLCIIFLQALTQNFFSGNLYTASWFWLSSALIISTTYYLKQFKNANSTYCK